MIGNHLSHYLIESELGRGGMGIVYRAQDTKLDRTVAIKVLPSAALASDDDRARFYREAKAAASLTHPHIAIIHGVDEAAPEGAPHGTEPSPFIAMEFVNGVTVEERIKEGPLPLEDAVRIASEFASGLEAAHKKDIVHRDIKSANIMLDEDGNAKILDFGLAQTAQSTRLTRLGSTLGTAGYMSPEQARGEQVNARTDLWSLGVVLYEMITGRMPFAGDYEQAIVYGILNEDPPPMTSVRAGVPMSLDWIVGKLLAKKADERYQSAAELLVDLKTADLTQAGLSRTTSGASSMSRVSATGALEDSIAPAAATGQLTGANPAASAAKRYLPYLLLIIGLVLGAAVMSQLGPPDQPPPVRYLHRNFETLRSSAWPAISESGRYLAVTGRDSVDIQSQLRVVDLHNNEELTIPNSAGASWPAFSQDESRIAFVSGGQLKIADIRGSEPLDVAATALELFVWALDGSIYFVTPSLHLTVVRPDGTVEPFMPGDSLVKNMYPNALSSDENIMIINGSGSDEGGVYAMDMQTGSMKKILDDGAWYTRYVSSGHLIDQYSANGRLAAYPFSVDELTITGLAQPIRPFVTPESWFVTRSGHFVSYGDQKIVLREMVSFDESGNPYKLLDEEWDYEEFQFSPSGDQVAVEINGYKGGDDQILIYDLIAGTSQQLTFGDAHFEPTWSPEGDRIAMVSQKKGGQDIGIKNIDGSDDITWITDNQTLQEGPDWSPTGEFIAYVSANSTSDSDILVYSIKDGTNSTVVDDPRNQTYPRVSPDGRFIAYESSQTRTTEVFVLNLETGSKTPVTQNGGFRPTWSKNGSKLYYALGSTLYEIDVSITDGFRVLGQPRMAFDAGSEFYFDVSDRGQIAAARKMTGESVTIEIIQNWSSTLEKPQN